MTVPTPVTAIDAGPRGVTDRLSGPVVTLSNALLQCLTRSGAEVLTDEGSRAEAGATLIRACGNCHSNQTILPWYGHVAPVSWWIRRHIRAGREELSFSEWTTYSAQRRRDELESICGVVSNGRMPPASYRVLHPESRLEAQDKKVICAWAAKESEHEK